jgi:Homing endonuclease associated repeat
VVHEFSHVLLEHEPRWVLDVSGRRRWKDRERGGSRLAGSDLARPGWKDLPTVWRLKTGEAVAQRRPACLYFKQVRFGSELPRRAPDLAGVCADFDEMRDELRVVTPEQNRRAPWSCPARRPGSAVARRRLPWTRERIIRALQADARRRGRPPTQVEWHQATSSRHGRPTAKTVAATFGSWSAGIAAAGLEPRPLGGQVRERCDRHGDDKRVRPDGKRFVAVGQED